MLDDEYKGIWRKIASALVIGLGILVIVIMLIEGGRGAVSSDFLTFYTLLGGFFVVIGFIAFISDFILPNDNIFGRYFYIYKRSMLRPLGYLGFIPPMVAVVGAIGIFLLISNSNFQFYSVPNPYTQSMVFQASLLSAHSGVSNIFNGAVVPGLLEEGLIFFAVQATTFVLMLILAGITRNIEIMQNPILYWTATFVSIPLWAFSFMYAHSRFSGNNALQSYAFIFEFITQSLNALTGSLISPLIHFAHNAAVVLNNAYSFVLSAIAPVFTKKEYWRRIKHAKMA